MLQTGPSYSPPLRGGMTGLCPRHTNNPALQFAGLPSKKLPQTQRHTPPAAVYLACRVPMGIASTKRLFPLATSYVSPAASHWALRLPCVFFCSFHTLPPTRFTPWVLSAHERNISDARPHSDLQETQLIKCDPQPESHSSCGSGAVAAASGSGFSG